MKLSDRISIRKSQQSNGIAVDAKLELFLVKILSNESEEKHLKFAADVLKKTIVETVQPRAELEAAFAVLRQVVRDCDIDMAQTMKILGAVAELQESVILR